MSTTFEVYPRTSTLPTFAAIINRSTQELHRFLDSVGIRSRPRINLRIQACADHSQLPFSLDDLARWDKQTYAWFMVGDVLGGTDAYFDDNAIAIREYIEGEFGNHRYKQHEALIRECTAAGHRWRFRRSIGQPAIINLTYGLIAGSMAAITDGFVYSMDSAWDYETMPALPEDFLNWYFRPEQTVKKRNFALGQRDV
jgi:hypothetical protein